MTDSAAPFGPIDELMPGSTTPRRRRTALAAAGAVGVAAVIGGGVWVSQSFLARGPQPAEALPASTLGYAAVDLDPSGSQKVEAAKFLGSFPSLSKGTSSGDLRERVFDLAMSDLTCDLDFKDVEPWVGDRAAIAVVGYDKPEFVTVLEVTDGPGLDKGLDKAEKCGGGPRGHAIRGDWAVIARSDAVAKSVLDDGAEAPLSRDADFKKWTDKAGDPGIVTLYAAPAAGDAILKAAEKEPFVAIAAASGLSTLDPIGMAVGMVPLFGVGMAMSAEGPVVDEGYEGDADFEYRPLTKAEQRRLDKMTPAEQEKFFEERFPAPDKLSAGSGGPGVRIQGSAVRLDDEFGMPEIPEEVRAALRDFRGAGGVVRFADGALEAEFVSDHIDLGANDIAAGDGGDDLMDSIPATAAIAYGAGLADGWEEHLFDAFGSGIWGSDQKTMIKEFEQGTGLDYPSDLEALGGSGFALVAAEGFQAEDLDSGDASTIAARLHGDPARVEQALAKLKTGTDAPLVWRRDGQDVLVGADKGLLDRLADGAGLNRSSAYTSVLPDAGGAASVLFIDFDADNWLAKANSGDDRANVEPLKALGYSRTLEEGDDHTLIRLTTD